MKNTYKIISAVMALIMLAVCMTVGSSALSTRIYLPEGYWYSYNATIDGYYDFKGNIKAGIIQGVPVIHEGYQLRVSATAVECDEDGNLLNFETKDCFAGINDPELSFSITYDINFDYVDCVFWGIGREVATQTYYR